MRSQERQKSGQSPQWRKCRSIRAKLNARKAERENRGRSWMGWRPQQKWQWSKKWKEKGQIFCDSMSKEHPTTWFPTACWVGHYLTLGLRSWNVEWGAFPVITEIRIKLPEKYKHQTESRATFSAPLGTKCQPERELTVFLGYLTPKINALRSSETSENIQRPVVTSEMSWIFGNNAVRENVKQALVKTELQSQFHTAHAFQFFSVQECMIHLRVKPIPHGPQ